jgi:hypothetical protein
MTLSGPGSERSHYRAADSDRELIVERLRVASAEGRLTDGELLQRTEAAYRARTYGELDALVADLPDPRVPARPGGAVPQPRRRVDVDRGLDRSLKAAWSVWAVAVSVNLVVWALVSLDQQDLTYFWPMWVAGPWGAVLVVLTVLRGGFRR